LESLQGDLAAAGGDPLILKTDLRQVGDVDPMVRSVIERFGRLDILVNNIERGGWPVVHGAYTCAQWDLEWRPRCVPSAGCLPPPCRT
jgi:3-oxoacyl-[acyl-carrier protein] reductase